MSAVRPLLPAVPKPAHVPDAVVYDLRDSLQYGTEELRKSWEECFEFSTSFKFEFGDPKITVDENVAFSYSLGHATGKTTEDENIDVWMRITTCYNKVDGKWAIVHEHSSVPGDFENGKILSNLKPENDLASH